MLFLILKIIISFLLAYWLAAVVIMAIGFFIFRDGHIKNWKYFIWIFFSAAILGTIFESIHYFNANAAFFATCIQILKVTNKDNKLVISFFALVLGWTLIYTVSLFIKTF
ncbi:MAG: hypothetical protein NT170_03650 [Candidatus Moranbacteria bacterium]|nr:hypothetical protein [Candidatus Moranbacteria bacterium]